MLNSQGTNLGLDLQDVWFGLAIPFIVGPIPPLTPSTFIASRFINDVILKVYLLVSPFKSIQDRTLKTL